MVGLYARVSTTEQAQNGHSLDEQIDRMKKYADAMGWDIFATYTDPGFSGGNTQRPALQRMIRDIRMHRIDRVLVYKLDRLSRSQKDTLTLIEDVFLAQGCEFVSMMENFDTSTPFGRAMIGVLAVFAQLEREQIKERMNMGKDASVRNGGYAGGTPPFGYKYRDGAFVADPYESMIVKEMFENALTMSPYAIANAINEKRQTSRHWDDQSVSRILSSKVYLGYRRYKKEWYRSNHEPIISEDLFRKVESVRASRRAQHEQYNRRLGKANSYLGGYLYCRCGCKYTKRIMKKTDRGRTYIYDRFMCASRPSCHNRTWKVDELTDIIFGEIRKLALDPSRLSQMQEQDDDRPEVIRNEIEKLTEQMDRLMDLYAVGEMPKDIIQNRIIDINEKKTRLEDELEGIKKENDLVMKDETFETIRSFSDILDRGDFDEIRACVGALIRRIDLDGDDIRIHWTFT